MVDMRTKTPGTRLRNALWGSNASARLQAALTAGTRPDESYIEVLVERCEVETNFFVRDMLTWALTRHDPALTVEVVLSQLHSESAQARSQALHTLSKIGDPATWAAITVDLLRDPDLEVARAAWRTAAGLVPQGRETELAEELVSQLGRGRSRDATESQPRVRSSRRRREAGCRGRGELQESGRERACGGNAGNHG